MKKLIWIVSLIGYMCVQTLSAQQARTCFVQMPDTLCPLLTAVNRADFVDFMDSKMKAEVSNRLGGKSEMTVLTPDFIEVRTSEQSTWQMKLLPVNDSTQVICTVSTVCAPVCDSHIRFYTTSWQELPASRYMPVKKISLDNFIASPSDTADVYRYQEARRQADLLLMKASLSASSSTLIFAFTTPDYMEKEAAAKLKPFICQPVLMEWKDGRFTY